MSSSAVEVSDLSKRYRLYHERNQSLKATMMRGRRARFEEFWALRDISLEVRHGETFGLIGENGSGKSTLLKCIARILFPNKGTVRTVGKISALLELGAGFHPELSGRENVYLNGAILGLSKRQIGQRFDEIVQFAGIEQFIDAPVKNYSSGMYVRLGFSIAINVEPDILLIDEILAVGDAEFQQRCTEKIGELRKAGNTIVVVSHSLGTVRTLCDRVALLEHGNLIEVGSSGDVIDKYLADVFTERSDGDESTSPLTRWGSGEVRIEHVEIIDAAGDVVRVPRTGERIAFRIHYRVEQAVGPAAIGLAIYGTDGTYVSGTSSKAGGCRVDLKAPTGSVDLVLERLPLLSGRYAITSAVFDETGAHTFDHVARILRFDVRPGAVQGEEGVVSLGGTWGGPGVATVEAT
jgi:ABC-2 type transport system ATP-binding protein